MCPSSSSSLHSPGSCTHRHFSILAIVTHMIFSFPLFHVYRTAFALLGQLIFLKILSWSSVMIANVPFSIQNGHSKALNRQFVARCSTRSFLIRSNSLVLSSSHLLGQWTRSNWQEAVWLSKVPTVPVHWQPLSVLAHLTCNSLISRLPEKTSDRHRLKLGSNDRKTLPKCDLV